MIPYVEFHVIPIGPLRIQVWGLFVALGILAALVIGRRAARRRGLDAAEFTDMAAWIVVFALIGGRLFHAFAYDPAPFLADPWKIFRVWEGGMSSYGGFIGAAIAAAVFVRRRHIPFLPYADAAAYALPCGYGIGRIGCFLIHDHPGTLSDSVLAVRYPGGDRLDHGLLLSILGLSAFALFFFLERKGRRGAFLPLFMVLYGAARFFLDFYRAWDLPGADARYWSLTPAQYGSAAACIAGAVWLARMRRTRHSATPGA
jgi:phosphatidylglycerol:prolipoprotein diacylglycerol transferase